MIKYWSRQLLTPLWRLPFHRLNDINQERIQTVVFHHVDRVGDALALLPAIKAVIASGVPHVIVMSTAYNQSIFEPLPGVHVYPVKNNKHYRSLYFVAKCIRKRFGKVDLSILCQSKHTTSTRLVIRALKAHFNYCLGETSIPWIQNARPKVVKPEQQVIAFNVAAMVDIGFKSVPAKFAFDTPLDQKQVAIDFLKQHHINQYIALNLFGFDVVKNFTIEGAVSAIQALQAKIRPCLPIVLLHVPQKLNIAQSIASQCVNVFCFDALSNVYQAAAIVESARLLVSPDTALIHFASAFNTPTLGLYWEGITPWLPQADQSMVLQYQKPKTVNSIDPNEIAIAAKQLLS